MLRPHKKTQPLRLAFHLTLSAFFLALHKVALQKTPQIEAKFLCEWLKKFFPIAKMAIGKNLYFLIWTMLTLVGSLMIYQYLPSRFAMDQPSPEASSMLLAARQSPA